MRRQGDAADHPASPGYLGLVWRLLTYASDHWVKILFIALALVVELAFETSFPIAVKLLVDNATTLRNEHLLVLIIGGLACAFVLAAVAGVWREHVSTWVGARTANDLRLRMFRHLQGLSLSFFAHAESGDILSRFSSDLAVVENALGRALPLAIRSGFQLVISLVMLFVLEWKLATITVVALPLTLLGPQLLANRASRASYRRREDEARVASAVQEAVGGQAIIRAFGLRDTAVSRFQRELDTLTISSVTAGFLSRLIGRTTSIAATFVQLLVVGIGTYLVFLGEVSIGSLIAFIGFLLNVDAAVSTLSISLPELTLATGGVQRVDELLATRPGVVDAPDARPLARVGRELRLHEVTFGYEGGPAILDRLSLTIHAGQYVALVGRSGSGKSTVLTLIARFYDPTSGRVTVDGEDLKAVSQDSWRAQLGVVFQETFLFNDTVRENIRQGRPDATDTEVAAAARAAQIHEVIAGWPAGYGTLVGERGSQLSGGQRQRVALARAILSDPAVLLLDEATSALDPVTEAAFNETLRHLARGRTVISVTHRLAGVVDADHIFVLEHGRLVEDGTHPALVALGGHYASLWNQQTGFLLSDGGRLAEVTAERLAKVPLFSSMGPETLQALAKLFLTEHWDEGRTIVQEGDRGDKFYVIVRGRAEVIRGGRDAEQRIAVLLDGDFFGEIALLDDVVRTATVRTVVPTVALSLARQHFLRLIEQEPALRLDLERAASLRRQELAASR